MFTKDRLRTIVALTLAISLIGLSSVNLSFAQATNESAMEAAASAAADAAADLQSTAVATIISGTIDVHSGPSTDYPILTTVRVGTQVSVKGRDALNSWLLIDIPTGGEGWISRSFTDYTELAPIVAIPPLAPPATTPSESTSPESNIVTTEPDVEVTVRPRRSVNETVLRTVTPTIARFLATFVVRVPILETQPMVTPPLAPPATAPPVTDPALATIATTSANVNVNVRAGPSTNYPVLRTVAPGTQMIVVGQDATSGWLSVRLGDGTEGWVARFLTNFMGTVAILAAPPLIAPPLAPPLAPPATAPPVTDPALATIVTAIPNINVNVRAGPSTNYAVLRTITAGTQITILGQDATSAWLLVRFSDGTEGWIARFLTNFVGTVPSLAAPPLSAPPLAPPATAPPVTVPALAPVVTTSPNLNVNVRAGPSMNHAVVRIVTPGTQLTVLGQDTTTAWLSVRLGDGTVGWVARILTNFVGTVPILAAPPLIAPPLAPPATAPPVTGPGHLPGQADSLTDPTPLVDQALSDNWRILRPGETHWYYFDHPGDESPIHIWMDSDPREGAGFWVYSERDAEAIMAGAHPDDFDEIGAGTPNEFEPGHLFWRGVFSEHGRFYVMIVHGGAGDVPYTIFGAGPNF